MAKRAFDLVASASGLLLLWPMMVVIALAVRLDSPGPALYRQVRVGRAGREFELLKFRSMVSGRSAKGPLVTASGDARITRVGRWLRSSKLDELPQLINVLRGDMSLVGPRPEVPRYVAMYPRHLRNVVLSVRPGITDEASIEFRDEGDILGAAADPEATYVRQILPRKLEIYERYVRDHSLAGDLRILWRTFVRVLRVG
jgi:lipopolysaccharide/colanic/teichoic acid biosynthesis glycosyltransferase